MADRDELGCVLDDMTARASTASSARAHLAFCEHGASSAGDLIWKLRRFSWSTICVLAACGTRGPSLEWSDFYGIQYQAPPGTRAEVTRSVLPGPGGLGGSPTDDRPYVLLAMAGPQRFRVTITKSRERETLDAMRSIYVANRIGTDHVGVTTPNGWELTYQTPRSDDPSKASRVHLIYADVGGGHYECIYDEQRSDPAVAEAICRSLRAKP